MWLELLLVCMELLLLVLLVLEVLEVVLLLVWILAHTSWGRHHRRKRGQRWEDNTRSLGMVLDHEIVTSETVVRRDIRWGLHRVRSGCGFGVGSAVSGSPCLDLSGWLVATVDLGRPGWLNHPRTGFLSNTAHARIMIVASSRTRVVATTTSEGRAISAVLGHMSERPIAKLRSNKVGVIGHS